MKRIVVVTDPHVPFQDKTALELLQKHLGDFQPHLFVIGGDLLDCYQISPFLRDPSRKSTFRQECEEAGGYLDSLAAVLPGGCERWLIGGNHEDRIRRYVWGRVPELADFDELDVPGFLDLERRKWGYIPYYDAVNEHGAPGLERYGLLILHGITARKNSAYTAKAHFERFHTNGICGHTHRQGAYLFRAWGGEYTWREAGCMCSIEPPYMPSPDWQQGYCFGWVHDEGDNPAPRFELHEAVIHNKKLAVEGRLYKA